MYSPDPTYIRKVIFLLFVTCSSDIPHYLKKAKNFGSHKFSLCISAETCVQGHLVKLKNSICVHQDR